jgi:hypothetical protein
VRALVNIEYPLKLGAIEVKLGSIGYFLSLMLRLLIHLATFTSHSTCENALVLAYYCSSVLGWNKWVIYQDRV